MLAPGANETTGIGPSFGFSYYVGLVDWSGPYWFWAEGDELVVPPGWTDDPDLSTQFYTESYDGDQSPRFISYDSKATFLHLRINLVWETVSD